MFKDELKCLLDTGSSKSFIKHSFIEGVNKMSNVSFLMTGANKHQFSTSGSIFSLAKIARRQMPFILQIVSDETFPSDWDVVLGADVLENTTIDLENKVLSFKRLKNSSMFCSFDQRTEQLLKLIDCEHLTIDVQVKLRNLCVRYSDVFYMKDFDVLKATNLLEHEIPLIDDKPVYIKQYQVPEHFKAIMQTMALDLKRQGIIRETMSPYNAPIVLAKKKSLDGKPNYRFCINFKKLNAVLKPSFFSLPKINDLFDQFKNSKIFSSLDLAESFLQISVKYEDQEKLAFTVPACGRFCYTRVPYGLQSSSFIFQKMIEMAMRDVEGILCYIDDCVVHSKSYDSNLKKLEEVFINLRKYKLSLNPIKCKFLKKNLIFLGHEIGENGVSIGEKRIAAIKDYKRPVSLTELRAFLAFVGFFRNHIDKFAEIAEPLFRILRMDKTKKNSKVTFYWNQEAQEAFEKMKNCVTTPPVLRFPDFEQQFIVHCDASQFCLGAQLSQMVGDKLHPIHYASHTLNISQRRMSVFEKEFLAIMFAMDSFKHYLLGAKEFLLFTDQKALIYAINQPFEFNNDKINRYKLKLTPFNFKICHIEGAKNICADFLSRINSVPEKALLIEDNSIVSLKEEKAKECKEEDLPFLIVTRSTRAKITHDINLLFEDFVNYKGLNKTYNHITFTNAPCDTTRGTVFIFVSRDLYDCPNEWRSLLKKENLMVNNIVSKNNLKFVVFKETHVSPIKNIDIFSLLHVVRDMCIDEKLVKIALIVPSLIQIPFFIFREMTKFIFKDCLSKVTLFKQKVVEITDVGLRKEILDSTHNSLIAGHPGVKRTLNRIADCNFHWVNIRKDVDEFINNCIVCNTSKINKHTKVPLCLTSSSDKCFSKLYIDIVGRLPMSMEGFEYLLTVKDDFSKFVFAIPLKFHTSEEIAHALVNKVFLLVGFPDILVMDNAATFNSDLMKQFCKLLKIKKVNISIYHAQANTVERFHKDLGNYFRSYVDKNPSDWPSIIPFAIFSHNTSVNYTTFSPFDLVFARKAELPTSHSRLYTYDDYVSQLKFLLAKSREIAKINEMLMKEKNKKYYDKNAKELNVVVGDKIFVKNVLIGTGQKMQKKYRGPFVVTQVLNNYNIKFMDGNKEKLVHKNLVKKFNQT